MSKIRIVALLPLLAVSYQGTASAAFYLGTGTLSGYLEDQSLTAYSITYSGPMLMEFASQTVEPPGWPPGITRTDFLMNLETRGKVSWAQVAPPPAPTGSAFAKLYSGSFVQPIVGGTGGVGDIYAPLVVDLVGVTGDGTNVFSLTQLDQVNDHIATSGWVANDVLGTNLDFTFNGTVIPEPASLVLLGIGLVGVAGSTIWRRKRS